MVLVNLLFRISFSKNGNRCFMEMDEVMETDPGETLPEETFEETSSSEMETQEAAESETAAEESTVSESEEVEEAETLETETAETDTVPLAELLTVYGLETADTSETLDTDAVVQAIEKQTEVVHNGFIGVCVGLGLLVGMVFVQGFRLRRV